MTFIVNESKVKRVAAGDPNFMLRDGTVTYPRAMLHVLPECPTNVRGMIQWAYAEGYLKCVAHIYEYEETFNALNTQ